MNLHFLQIQDKCYKRGPCRNAWFKYALYSNKGWTILSTGARNFRSFIER